tara:strand:- start:891 stop:1127 length:237 start_codon:yes stop_codon:yes gene_type:complete
MGMSEISVSEFKAKALGVLDQVFQTKEEIIVTKRGMPIAKVIPFFSKDTDCSDRLKDYLIEEVDVVTPMGSGDWESAK